MKVFKFLLILVILSSLHAQTTDSLTVKTIADTVVITNYGAVENCCAAFDFSIDWENDSTLVISEIDTGQICRCGDCTFDLELKMTNLAAGHYTAKVYRDALMTPKIYIGEISFYFEPSQSPQHSFMYSGVQGPCYHITTYIDEDETTPDQFKLYDAYPNPFNSSVVIKYSIGIASHVVLSVFDIQGKEVKSIIDQVENAGIYKQKFDAGALSSGIYIVSLSTDQFSISKKIILIK